MNPAGSSKKCALGIIYLFFIVSKLKLRRGDGHDSALFLKDNLVV